MESLERALAVVDNSLDRIKSFTKVALNVAPEDTVKAWRSEVQRRLTGSLDALPLVNCCNDVVQESKGDLHERYCKVFSAVLHEDLRAILDDQPDLGSSLKKVLRVWSDRQVFEVSFIASLRSHLFTCGDDEREAAAAVLPVVQEKESYQEQEHRILSAQPLSRILSLTAWLEQNDNLSIPEPITNAERDVQRLKGLLSHEENEHRLQEMLSTMERLRSEIVKRRRVVQGRLPAAKAARQTLEIAVKRAEESLQSTTENSSQSEKLDEIVRDLLQNNVPSSADFSTVALRLLPKRERIVKQVVQGPDLFNLGERVMREGLTTEAAAKADRPMVYHKGLQKWVPLQTGEDADGWRD